MLVFLAADERRVDELLGAVADELAWRSVADEAGALNLTPQQEAQAGQRSDDAGATVDARLAETYQLLLVPRLESPTSPVIWQEIKADGPESLVERAGRKLSDAGALYLDYPAVLLRLHLDGDLAPLWAAGAVTVGTLWNAYSRYLYLHRLRDIGAGAHPRGQPGCGQRPAGGRGRRER